MGVHRKIYMSPTLAHAFLVGHDVLGGFFAINGGAFEGQECSVFYFAPDTLRWEDIGMTNGESLQRTMTGDVAGFYGDQRWPGWQEEVQEMSGDEGFLFMPLLWASGPSLEERSRRIGPQRERWTLHQDLARQLAEVPSGTPVRLRFLDPLSS